MTSLKEIILLILASMLSLTYSQQHQPCTYFISPVTLLATTTAEEIRLPPKNEEFYRANENCKWVLHTEQENHVIKLTVLFRELEGHNVRGDCVADYIDIFDVRNQYHDFKERLCGRGEKELSFKSSESAMVVQFISNERYQYRGFQATFESYYEKPSDTPLALGVTIGISIAVIALVAILCAIVILCRLRKRKRSERAQSLVHSQAGAPSERALSTQNMSPPSYSTDFSPFVNRDTCVTGDPHQFIALSTRSRTDTPPPPYDSIDQGVSVDTDVAPPPSYETVLRESSALRESLTMEPTAENVAYV